MKKVVYVETTIPSFYYETREELEVQYRKERTMLWWDKEAPKYSLATSSHVFVELKRGEHPMKDKKIKFLGNVEVLEHFDLLQHIIATYINEKLMPAYDIGDATHLAYASYYKCDYLLTWNCEHLANANKTMHLRVINNRLGLWMPEIVTPDNLIEGE